MPLLWTGRTRIPGASKGTIMAEEEPLLTNPPTQDAAAHVRDYEGFVRLFKWGAIASLLIAFLVILIIT